MLDPKIEALIVLAVLAVALWRIWTPTKLRKSYLPNQKIATLSCHVTGQSRTPSVHDWERACASSINASRRRRGWPEEA